MYSFLKKNHVWGLREGRTIKMGKVITVTLGVLFQGSGHASYTRTSISLCPVTSGAVNPNHSI